MQQTFNWAVKFRIYLTAGLVIAVLAAWSSPLVAAIARGYMTQDSGLQTGMVVSLSSSGSDDEVERASQEESSHVIGVATTSQGSLVTVSSGSAQVLVESEGQVDTYVSDIAGAINKGDLLVLSPLKGVLMKASDANSARIIGIATHAPIETELYEYQEGADTKQTQIAKIKVDLNYLGTTQNSAEINNSALAKLGRTITGKDVGEIRVLIALIIFVIVLIAEGGILYGATSSAVTALGRNPMARTIIRSELIRIIMVAIIVLLVGLGAVYAVLRA